MGTNSTADTARKQEKAESRGFTCEGDDVEGKGVNDEEVEKNGDANGIKEHGDKNEEDNEEEDPDEDVHKEEMPTNPRLMGVNAKGLFAVLRRASSSSRVLSRP
ncbi:hypothetical protein PIB30_052997 [Stylosanthes scabra]|uniref:Uncharacterized protein n=1 Tax=Stylosanthes scabra TaxID=79078 RepID=A0ABU6XHA0_9FABA|nr:hypothetical protein [Stylosanthes scabra]